MKKKNILRIEFCGLTSSFRSTRILLLIFIFIFQHKIVLAQNQLAKESPGGTWYYEYLPADYNSNTDDYPIMIFFHGLGERGNNEGDLTKVAKNGPPLHVKNGHDFPFILISPQLKTNLGNWPPNYMDEVVEHVLNDGLRIDLNRIYVTGLSLGGGGAWFYAHSFPEKIAAVAPVCGSRNNLNKACNIAAENIPVWAFHGDADGVVPLNRTTLMIDALNECTPAINPAPLLTVYEGIGHNSWSRAYRTDNSLHTPNIYEWFMQQSRASISVDAGEDITLNLPTNNASVSGTASSTAAISTYLWEKVSGPSATLSNTSTATLSVSNAVAGIYQFRLTATDADGNSASDQMKLTVVDSNSPPTANAGSNKQIQLPTSSTTISGTGTDSDGNIISYSWQKISGGAVTISNANQATLNLSALQAGIYVFELTVEDDDNVTDSDEMQLEVLEESNLDPIANAGVDIQMQLPTNSTNLVGSGTDDDGTISNYLWEKTSGPSVSLSNVNNSTATASNLVTGTYTFRLTVTDDDGASDSDLKNVTVLDANQVPTVSVDQVEQSITLPTNTVNIQASASDLDGNIASYLWEIVSEVGSSSLLNSSSSTLTVNDLDVAGQYVYSITVTDNEGATNTAEATVNVNDQPVNQLPNVNAGPDKFIVLPTNQVILNGTASDPDGTIVNYAWIKVSGGNATLTGENTQTLTASNLVEGNYRFRLTVTDDDGAKRSNAVDVNVAPEEVNIAPIVDAGNNKSITLPTNSVTIIATASDDGMINSYLWEQISGNAGATLSGTNSSTLEVGGLTEGLYNFQITVEDDGGSFASDEVSVTVTAINTPPVANAGSNKNITLPKDSVDIIGSGTDEDGEIVSYQWTQSSGPASATLINENQATLEVKDLIAGQYRFEITVTDNDGDSDVDDLQVTVNEENNISPNVNAGNNRNLNLPTNSITINGVATDSDGSVESIEWTQVSGPSAGILTNISTLNLTASGLIEGDYVFRLSATDDDGAQASDEVTVTVIPEDVNSFPIVDAGENVTIKLPTNAVTLNGAASDVDGSVSSYNWTKISGGAATLTNQNTANLTLSGLIAGSYTFRLSVTDNEGASSFDEVFVFVLSESTNESPVANAGSDRLIVLPLASVTINGSGADNDGQIVSYEWSQVSGSSLTLANINLAKLTVSDLIAGQFVFQLKVIDDGGVEDSDEMTLTVSEEEVNQPPVADAGTDKTLVLPTNSIVLNGSGFDPEGNVSSYLWTKTSGGNAVLTNATNAKLTVSNLELGTYWFRLKVIDSEGLSSTDQMILTVLPENTNKIPTVNAGPNKNIKLPQNQITINGTASDSDGSISEVSWSKLSGGNGNLNNQNTLNLELTDLEAGNYTLELTATDNDNASATDLMSLTVLPEDANSPPTVNAGSDIQINLPNNSTSITANASDPDGDEISYFWSKISGPQLFIADNDQPTVNINDLVEGTYQIRIRVTDTEGAVAEDLVQIQVLSEEIIEPPVVNAGPNLSVELPSEALLIIGEAESENGTIATVLWEQIAGENLTLSGENSNQLTIDDLSEGIFTFRFTATDNTGQSSFDEVQLNVLPEEEEFIPQPPTLSAGGDIILQLPDSAVTIEVFAQSENSLIASYSWEQLFGPTDLLIRPDTSNVVELSNFKEGAYYVRVNVSNIDSLENSATKRITVLAEDELARPRKLFSPNGDGIDDFWQIEGVDGIDNCQIQVFDRSGKNVFESTGYANEWDGNLNGNPLPEGAYYYVINCSDIAKKLTGTVVIIR
ncbi:PKD domain-containing protein [Marivirga harenae]|uniref:PKD domain-containing protein n=1 Tax=Marivirga harenae TaxID=2010992 RepID=UPI0026DF06A0|nr:tandem-95 repeat protein [Marivirga harenae]WKV12902.1 tandem-95 repeat protein [Marivirga harenae]